MCLRQFLNILFSKAGEKTGQGTGRTALTMAGLLLLCVCAYKSVRESVYLWYTGERSAADGFETAERSQVDPSETPSTASEMLTAVFVLLFRSF